MPLTLASAVFCFLSGPNINADSEYEIVLKLYSFHTYNFSLSHGCTVWELLYAIIKMNKPLEVYLCSEVTYDAQNNITYRGQNLNLFHAIKS